MLAINNDINVQAKAFFVETQSDEAIQKFAFAYHISIHNQGEYAAKLLNRHWLITDANGKVITVEGEGVIGQQPVIKANQTFHYQSGAIIETPVGTMQGYYQMLINEQVNKVIIPVFRLAVPGIVN